MNTLQSQDENTPIDTAGASFLGITARSTDVDTIRDIGTVPVDVSVRSLILKPVTLKVRVRENCGRYAGNWAEREHCVAITATRDGLHRTMALFILLVIASASASLAYVSGKRQDAGCGSRSDTKAT